MKPKLYFERGSELCYTKAAILERLKEQGLRQVEVFEAEKESVPGFRWCRYKGDMIETGSCDRSCEGYNPCNGRSGRCMHLGNNFYTPTDKKVIIKLK